MKFNAKYMREFEVQIDAPDIKIAEALAKQVIGQFPTGSCKLMSIYIEGYVEPVDPGPQTSPSRGKPGGGGSPGTPVISAPAIVDQIAKAA